MPFPQPFYRWRPHPWHGLEPGRNPPEIVQAYIEISPFDVVKYELDKTTGYLRVDRPQRLTSQPPTLYGFIPRTFCGARVRALTPSARRGDQDPLDICVVSERPIERSDLILDARVVGGMQCIDDGEADDKIVAVIEGDAMWRDARAMDDLPAIVAERLRHYFSTYKMRADGTSTLTVERVYDREHAGRVIEAAIADYQDEYGD